MIDNTMRKLAVLITVVILFYAAPLSADSSDPIAGILGVFGQLNASEAESQSLDTRPSKPEFETIQGNDTPMGYILSHGNVIARSESVTVAGNKLFRNVDYLIDYRSGAITFRCPVKAADAVRVSYRYAEGDTGERTVLSVPALPIASSDRLSLNFTYAYRAASKSGDRQGADVATYGFNSTTKLGASSSLSGMLFVSNPQKTENRFSDLNPSGKASAVESGSDELIVQNADLGLGNMRLQLNYQDVGSDFQGFQALRDSRAADAGLLNQLEKEKGLKRIGVGLQFASGASGAPGAPVNGLLWNSVGDGTGEYDVRSFSFSSGGLGFHAATRGADAGFQRMKDLSEAELTDLALQVRQQFTPEATAAQVTSDDRKQVIRSAGIERSSYGLSFGSGSSADSVRMFTIGDQSGDIERTSFKFAGKAFNVSGFRQSIDAGFSRMADMTDVEKQQFGNERGMERLNLGGDFTLGDVQATMSFARVDSGTGGISRRSLGIKGQGFDVRASFQDIDASFDRLADLADPDRKNLEQDRGYNRMDITGRFDVSPKLNVQSYVYDAHNDSQGMDRKQLRNQLVFTPTDGMRMSILSDQFSFTSTTGNIDSYSRLNFDVERKFAGGLFIRVVRDVLDRQVAMQDPLTTTTQVFHIETDAAKKDRTFAVLDRKTIDYGDGRFENTSLLDVQSTLSRTLSIKGSYLDIDRGAEPSETTNSYSVQWAIREGLALSANFLSKDTNNNQDVESRSLSMVGSIFRNLAWFSDGKLVAEFMREEHNGQVKKDGQKVKLETLLAGGSMMIEYAGLHAADGSSPLSKAIRFISNRDPAEWLHFDMFYKYRDDGPAAPFLVRAYNIDARINEATRLLYSYSTYAEAADGKVTPTGFESIKLTTVLWSGFSLVADYRKDENYTESRTVAPITLGIAGKLDSGALVELGFGRSLTVTPAGSVEGNTYKVKFDHQVSVDHFINFSAAFTAWDSSNSAVVVDDELEARLDYQSTFDW